MKSFVREKRSKAGRYTELDLYIRTAEQEKANSWPSRKRRRRISKPAQQNLNNKNRKRYARLLMHGNFGDGDYYLHLTYKDDFLPERPSDAKKQIENYLKRLRRQYRENGQELKYMCFTEFVFDDETGYIKRIHHHLVLSSGISRDAVEAAWSCGRGKNKTKIGITRCSLIQDGINNISLYLSAQEKQENRGWKKGEKLWSSSQNLVKPYEEKNDHKHSMRQLEAMGKDPELWLEKIREEYPHHELLIDPRANYFDKSGWHLHVELLDTTPAKPKKKRRKRSNYDETIKKLY